MIQGTLVSIEFMNGTIIQNVKVLKVGFSKFTICIYGKNEGYKIREYKAPINEIVSLGEKCMLV